MAVVEWAILCDYAFLDAARKVCLIGIFDRIFAAGVPSVHPQAALAVRLVGNPGEVVDLRAEIVRPTGEVLLKIEGRGELGQAGTADLQMALNGLLLPDYGIYAVNVHLAGVLAKSIPLTVAQLPSSPGVASDAPPPPSLS